MNTRAAGFLDFFYIIAIFFVIGITVMVALMVVNVADNSGLFNDYTDADNVIKNSKNTLLSMDNMMLLAVVGLSLFVIVSSALVNNHPAYFIAGIFLLIIAITVAAIASNAFYIFTNDDVIAATAASFPKLTFLFNRFPLYILFMGIATAISMFIGYKQE